MLVWLLIVWRKIFAEMTKKSSRWAMLSSYKEIHKYSRELFSPKSANFGRVFLLRSFLPESWSCFCHFLYKQSCCTSSGWYSALTGGLGCRRNWDNGRIEYEMYFMKCYKCNSEIMHNILAKKSNDVFCVSWIISTRNRTGALWKLCAVLMKIWVS